MPRHPVIAARDILRGTISDVHHMARLLVRLKFNINISQGVKLAIQKGQTKQTIIYQTIS